MANWPTVAYTGVGTWPERRHWVQQLMYLLGVTEMYVEWTCKVPAG